MVKAENRNRYAAYSGKQGTSQDSNIWRQTRVIAVS